MCRKLLFIFFILPFYVVSQSYPLAPSNYVTDEADVLSEEQERVLNSKCRGFEDSTSNQIFVYTTPSLNGKEMQPLCQEIFHAWHIGQKGKNNGVLVAIFVNDHKFRIHTGYGLEGALPDLLTKKIQDKDMKPLFKEKKYFEGINKGIDQLVYYSQHEYKAESEFDPWLWIIGWGLNAILLIAYLYNLFKKRETKKKKKNQKEKSVTVKIIWAAVAIVVASLPCIGAIILFVMVAMVADFPSYRSSNKKQRGSTSSNDYSTSSSSDSSSSSSSDSDFGGGGGGDSGGGGSDSDW